MAENDSSVLDYTKPFTVGYWMNGQYHEKITYPLKSSVANAKTLGLRGPWDREVLR